MSRFKAWSGWLVVASRNPMKVLVVGPHRPGVVLVKMPSVMDAVAQRLDCVYRKESDAWLACMERHQRAAERSHDEAEQCRRRAMEADAREIAASMTGGAE